jgi:hypothetical protein
MSTFSPDAPDAPATSPASRSTPWTRSAPPPWVRLLVVLSVVVAATDVLFLALIAEVIPPLAIGALLTAVGVGLLRRAPRSAILVLGLTNLLMLVSTVPFAADHLAHPASALDFSHAVVATFGRAVAVVAAVGAWRRAAAAGARRLGAAAVVLGAVTILVATVAMLTGSGDEAGVGDAPVTIEQATFPEEIEVTAGGTLFVDNRDLFRHTFTVESAGLDVELPATRGVRIPLDLPIGVYEVSCAVPGHDFMSSTLEVR